DDQVQEHRGRPVLRRARAAAASRGQPRDPPPKRGGDDDHADQRLSPGYGYQHLPDDGGEGVAEVAPRVAAIKVADLRKSYGAVEAVKGISFEVAEGEGFALLGPNGAGKTTTVEILGGYRRRDGGTVSVLGMDPESGGSRLRERIGVVLPECGVEEMLTGRGSLGRPARHHPARRPVRVSMCLEG